MPIDSQMQSEPLALTATVLSELFEQYRLEMLRIGKRVLGSQDQAEYCYQSFYKRMLQWLTNREAAKREPIYVEKPENWLKFNYRRHITNEQVRLKNQSSKESVFLDDGFELVDEVGARKIEEELFLRELYDRMPPELLRNFHLRSVGYSWEDIAMAHQLLELGYAWKDISKKEKWGDEKLSQKERKQMAAKLRKEYERMLDTLVADIGMERFKRDKRSRNR